MLSRAALIVFTIAAAGSVSIISHVSWRGASGSAEAPGVALAVGTPGSPPTSAEGLRRRIGEMEDRLRERPDDASAAVVLADALLRQARVTGDGRPTGRAEAVLTSLLRERPGHYEALRMLGAVLLSQHRFRDALETGRRARDLRPHDAWNYGVIGDALIELGDYEAAFDAIDTMVRKRPGAAAYARVAYARELQGNLHGALEAMQMAIEATSAHDLEAQAWHASQIGELHLRVGNVDAAEREYRRAAFIFPDYPLAVVGQGKVQAARGDRDAALATYLEQLKRTPTLDLAARIGDLRAQAGDWADAEHYYQLAESVAGPDIAQTEADLALFLAERGRRLPDAVKIAEALAATRDDIFTQDALAWAYFKAGRLEEASAASRRALRTGTRDARIRSHASEIERACDIQSSDC